MNIIALIAALSLLPMTAAAQAAPAEVPVLRQFVGSQWMYFARDGDPTLEFGTGNWSGLSNVWVAVKVSPINRKILAKTEVWTDDCYRPHSLSVLKLQLEFNEFARQPRYDRYKLNPVLATGILDRATLSIPFERLSLRASLLSDAISVAFGTASSLEKTDPQAATLKRKYAEYLQNKAGEARGRLRALNDAIQSVPLTTRGHVPHASTRSGLLDGLDDKDIPPFWESGYLRRMQGGDRVTRYSWEDDNKPPELFVMEFVDPLGMTPAVAADLKDKEAAASEAVNFVENACRDLFSLACP